MHLSTQREEWCVCLEGEGGEVLTRRGRLELRAGEKPLCLWQLFSSQDRGADCGAREHGAEVGHVSD